MLHTVGRTQQRTLLPKRDNHRGSGLLLQQHGCLLGVTLARQIGRLMFVRYEQRMTREQAGWQRSRWRGIDNDAPARQRGSLSRLTEGRVGRFERQEERAASASQRLRGELLNEAIRTGSDCNLIPTVGRHGNQRHTGRSGTGLTYVRRIDLAASEVGEGRGTVCVRAYAPHQLHLCSRLRGCHCLVRALATTETLEGATRDGLSRLREALNRHHEVDVNGADDNHVAHQTTSLTSSPTRGFRRSSAPLHRTSARHTPDPSHCLPV